MTRSIFRIAVVSYLLLPFLVLIWKLDGWAFPPFDETAAAFAFTFKQALLSAVISVALGFWGAMGLFRWPLLRKSFEVLFFLPNLLPTLFVLLSCLKFFSPFPFGLAGIVLVHVVLNTGLAAVSIARVLDAKVGGWAELALVEGASKGRFFRAAFSSINRDLGVILLFVFSICFASLTVPLVAGRFDGLTTEVLIYEKVRISGEWGQAFGLSLVQTGVIFALTFLLSKNRVELNSTSRNLTLLSNGWGLAIPIVFSLVVILSLFDGVAIGIAQLTPFQDALMAAWRGTWIVGGGVGLLTLLLLAVIVYASPHSTFQKFLIGYVTPSSVLTGFAILIFDLSWPDRVQMIFGITLIQLPLFYRLYLNAPLEAALSQTSVARTLGAGWPLIFFRVTWPQLAPHCGFAAGLAALWACGEFAISSLIVRQDQTLSLMIKGLISSYRLEAATAALWILMLTGLVLWFVFWGLSYGLSSKSRS